MYEYSFHCSLSFNITPDPSSSLFQEVLQAPSEELMDASKALLSPILDHPGSLGGLPGALKALQFPWRPALHHTMALTALRPS